VNLRRPCLCLITDRRRLAPDARTASDAVRVLEQWLDDAMSCVDLIQIREPDLTAGALFGLVSRVVARASGSGTMVVVNDRADVAAAAGAGVHLKGASVATVRARPMGTDSWVVGRSVHTVDEVRREMSASYILFGTMFATASKPAGAPVQLQGLEGLAAAVRAARVPVLAIGGVTPDRAAGCLAAGAAGVAAIGPFLPPNVGGMGVRAAAAAFREAMIS
jgi:thiamine-phosphate diphosphorylase